MSFEVTFILFGSFLAILIGTGQLIQKHGRQGNYTYALFFLSVSVWQFLNGFDDVYSGQRIDLANSIMDVIGSVALIFTGPLLYFYFQHILQDSYSFRKQAVLHFLPGVFAIALSIYFIFFAPHTSLSDTDNLFVLSILRISTLVALIYVLVLLRQLLVLIRNSDGENKGILNFSLFFLIYLIAAVVLDLYGRPNTSGMMITIALILIYLLNLRFPEFMLILQMETEKVRYTQSRILALDIDSVRTNLENLMNDQFIYRDDMLSLARLSKMLHVTPHQLSELINTEYKKNFFNYINAYRIDEAKKILLDHPAETILTIAYQVGFNSSSSFYTAFKKMTGTTPGAYRKRHRKEENR